jgi:zinc transporter ZupT
MEKMTIKILQWLMMTVGVALIFFAFKNNDNALYAIGGIFFALGFAIYFYFHKKAEHKKFLLQNGRLIQADFTEVVLNQSLQVNGRNPYQIIAQWHDKASNQIHVYKSENLWFNPTQFINMQKMPVYIDTNNPKKHYMDISFLPNQ